MNHQLPADWQQTLSSEFDKPYFAALETFVDAERAANPNRIYPPEELVFNAFNLTPFETVRVFIMGQDPYHGRNQAHGLAFSVQKGIAPPPSLANIFRELKSDVGATIPNNGLLVPWASQGVMMLNAVLTVRAGEANSHKSKGWEKFTDAAIKALSERENPLIFLLWGGYAQKKAKLIDSTRHTVLQGVHPSPLSAHNGFFGSKPFSQINALLEARGEKPIDWQLPNVLESILIGG